MTAHTKLSAKGQVVIPKEVRERLDWTPGTALEVEESADGVLLRRVPTSRRRLSYDEFRRRMPKYDGPPASIEEMNEAILREAARRWKEKEQRSR